MAARGLGSSGARLLGMLRGFAALDSPEALQERRAAERAGRGLRAEECEDGSLPFGGNVGHTAAARLRLVVPLVHVDGGLEHAVATRMDSHPRVAF